MAFIVSLSGRCNLDPLTTNPIKWSNKLKLFVSKLPTNCLSVFDHFVKLVLKGLRGFNKYTIQKIYCGNLVSRLLLWRKCEMQTSYKTLVSKNATTWKLENPSE